MLRGGGVQFSGQIVLPAVIGIFVTALRLMAKQEHWRAKTHASGITFLTYPVQFTESL